MKKLLVLLLLSLKCMSQSNDPVNEETLKFLMEQPVETITIKNFLKTKTSNIANVTSDSIVKKNALSFLEKLDKVQIVNAKTIDTDKLSKDILKDFKFQKDKFTDNSFLTYKKTSIRTPFSIYIAINKTDAYLRVKTDYSGESWIFMDKVTMIIDGQKYQYSLKKTEREVEMGRVTENSDLIADENLLNIIKALSETKSDVDIRLQGESAVSDGVLKEKQLLQIRETYNFFNSY